MAKKQEFAIDIGDMKSAILREDGSLIIMARQSISDFTEHDWATVVVISRTGVKNIKSLLTRAAEQRNEAEGEQTCPSCSGVGHYLVGMFHETCSWCEGTGHV